MKIKTNLKILILFIILIAISVIPNKVLAVENVLKYNIDLETKEISVSCHDKLITDITIPATYNGYKVTSIDFSNCENLKSVKISEGIKKIESFENCANLNNVILPNSVNYLANYVFGNCTKLEKIQLPNNITELPEYCFAGCTSLNSITIPENVKNIRKYAFAYCYNIEKINFNNKLERIEDFAFIGCEKLDEVVLPPTIKLAYNGCFLRCTSLKKVVLPPSWDIQSTGMGDTIQLYGIFDDCSENLVLYVVKGSDAEMYAINEGLNYKIYRQNLKDASIKVTTSSQKYTGKEIKPKVIVKYLEKELKLNTDYTVSYKNNKNIGTATVTIKGKGKYEGTVTKTFKIVIGQIKNIKTKTQDAKSITIKWNRDTAISGYEVYMSTNKNKGYKKVATIKKNSITSYKKTKLSAGEIYYFKVRAYKTVNNQNSYGVYSTILTTNTKIATPTISKLTAGNQKATLKWKKVSGAKGYEIYMSTSKNGTYKKVETITKGNTLTYTQKHILGKRTYYKIRAYGTINNKKMYSDYSKVKSVKVNGSQYVCYNVTYYENLNYSGPAQQQLEFKSANRLKITYRMWLEGKTKWFTDTYKYTIKGNVVTLNNGIKLKINNNNNSFYYKY